MLKDVTLGQYFPGESPLHRADPRTKVILSLCYIIALFCVKSALGMLLCALTLVCFHAASRIPLRTVLSGVKPILFILVFTFLINLFWTRGETLLVSWKFIRIYREGIATALMMAVRILLLVTGSGIFLTYTTSPIMLTDAIEQLLSPLKKIKVPVHDFSMMMTIALRFIPTLIEETDRIMDAQRARGASFSTGGLIRRAKALIPILIPLFVCAFKRADDLAVAMECRCYRGGEGRTRMTRLRFLPADYLMMLSGVLLIAAVILLNRLPVGIAL